MSRTMRLSLCLAAITLASGCLSSPIDDHWGKSYEAHAEAQVADPEAPASSEPPEDLDPETGRRVAERYYEGQEKQRQRRTKAVVIGDL